MDSRCLLRTLCHCACHRASELPWSVDHSALQMNYLEVSQCVSWFYTLSQGELCYLASTSGHVLAMDAAERKLTNMQGHFFPPIIQATESVMATHIPEVMNLQPGALSN